MTASALRPLNLLVPGLPAQCRALLEAGQVPGASIAVVVGDRGYHYSHGVASLASGEPVRPETAFNIGSCSKAFASATVASLVASGQVRWDDPVVQWVPELKLWDPEITRRVTLRDLSANRLGLPRAGLTEFGADPALPAEWIFERLQFTEPLFPFRDRFGYVNAGHTVNSVAAGRITGQGFLPTLRERILAPLGMNDTTGGAAARQELRVAADWHVSIDGTPRRIDAVFTDQYLAAGGMWVSGRDAVQWLRLHLNGGLVDGRQVIARDALLETHRPHSVATPGKDGASLFYPGARMAAYALGWGVSDLEGEALVAHSGGDLGITAQTLLLPRAGIGVAVYCNVNGPGSIVLATAYAVAAALLGLKPRDWLAYFEAFVPPVQAAPVPAADAGSPVWDLYAGTYEHPGDGPLSVERTAEGLRGTLVKGNRMLFDLAPLGDHRFHMRWVDPVWRNAPGIGALVLSFVVEAGRSIRCDLASIGSTRRFVRTGDGP